VFSSPSVVAIPCALAQGLRSHEREKCVPSSSGKHGQRVASTPRDADEAPKEDFKNAAAEPDAAHIVETTSYRSHRQLVVSCDIAGNVVLLEPQSGKLLTQLHLPGPLFSSPVVFGGVICIGCRDDHLYSIEIEQIKLNSFGCQTI
jgi:hypothetical protein